MDKNSIGLMTSVVTPEDVAAPFGNCAHGVLVVPGCRWLHVSGQVGVQLDGALATSAEAQIERALENVLAVLRAAGMEKRHLVKLTALVTQADQVPLYRTVRDRLLEGALVASTTLVVAGLANPDWLVEIEAVAAAPAR